LKCAGSSETVVYQWKPLAGTLKVRAKKGANQRAERQAWKNASPSGAKGSSRFRHS
jgi:hypothetical protein